MSRRTLPKRPIIMKAWSDLETDQLCDMISDGWSFEAAARKLKRTKNACIGRWHNHVLPLVGAQAR